MCHHLDLNLVFSLLPNIYLGFLPPVVLAKGFSQSVSM